MSKGTSSKILEEIKRIEDVPGFVYLIRNKALYKIGITISMKRRVKELKPDEVVAVKEAANMRGIEKLLHKRYKDRRIPQTEYFRLTPEEVDEASYLLGAGDLSEDDTQSVTDKETEKAWPWEEPAWDRGGSRPCSGFGRAWMPWTIGPLTFLP